ADMHPRDDRRSLLKLAAAGAAAAALPAFAGDEFRIRAQPRGGIPVAFLLSHGAVVIDFAGPWEVFQDVRDFSRGDDVDEVVAFRPFTVARTKEPIVTSGGLTIVPNHTFATAPQPRLIVIPAQIGAGDEDVAWIREAGAGANLVMSVCAGAFLLARTGLLDGKSATTHHAAFTTFEQAFPNIKLERDKRFVDHGKVATSAGLSAGIDLALHVVSRYFGVETAAQTARTLEYPSDGWRSPQLRDSQSRDQVEPEPAAKGEGYVCPPCGCAADGRLFKKPGKCPACGMVLIKKD